MENITLAKVGNGTAVHIYTSTEFGEDYTETNTACGAVEYNGRGRSGSKLAIVGEGTIEQVTCKRCLKAYNTDAARTARENKAERAALAAGLEAGRPMIEDTVETPAEEVSTEGKGSGWIDELNEAATAAGWEIVENNNPLAFAARGIVRGGNLWIEASVSGNRRKARVVNGNRGHRGPAKRRGDHRGRGPPRGPAGVTCIKSP